ncbi:MAG: right-handed parallel beta-helix repeat-containing protein, partial [Candidatus Pacebacteria bacterium]|nr:right-handed parallel beta-helix repeat-containing protein [Candidatus Paceibacterota bacterium]
MTTSLKYILVTIIAFIGLFIAPTVFGATLVVDTTNDSDNSGVECSLRDAINAINTGAPVSTCVDTSGDGFGVNDRIHFDIPGAGPHTITALSGLPNLNQPVVIDGTTQAGASCGVQSDFSDRNLLIEVHITETLRIESDNISIQGLSMISSGLGIIGLIDSRNNISFTCSHFGVDASGTTASLTQPFWSHIQGVYEGGFVINNLTIEDNIFGGRGEMCGPYLLFDRQPLTNTSIQRNYFNRGSGGIDLGLGTQGGAINISSDTNTSSENIIIADNVIHNVGHPLSSSPCPFSQEGINAAISIGGNQTQIVRNITIDNNTITESGGTGVSFVENITITNNAISDIQQASGIQVSDSQDITISDNTISNILDRFGIHINDSQGVEIYDNTIFNIDASGTGAALVVNTSQGVLVYENYVYNLSPQTLAVFSGESDTVVFDNNIFENTGGMNFSSLQNITITSNTLDSISDDLGTLLLFQSQNITISDNTITQSEGFSAIFLALVSNTSITNNIITNNNFENAAIALFGIGPAPSSLQNNNTLSSNIIHSNNAPIFDIIVDPTGDFDLSALTLIGLNPNDAGDIDEGPNNLQNHPIIRSFTISGNTITITFEAD